MSGVHLSSFGTRLRRYREAAGLSQEDLAERASLAAKAIGALERGERRRPYPRTVQMLADALQLNDMERRELIASVPRATAHSPADGDVFVGRERELGELVAKLRATANDRGGITMLLGEAGIGKTRLAQEFMAVARAQGTVVLSGRALEGDGQAPYGPWVEAIERYAIARNADDLRRDLGFDAPYIAQLVPVIRSRLTDVAHPETLAANDERLRLYGAVARFCSAVGAGGPVLVFLDDLHWADRDTLGLMRYMARTLTESRVLLLGAYRDPELGVDASHPLMAALSALRHDIACPTIRLRGFDHQEIVAYLTRAAGRPLTSSLVERIGRETSGNPFYAREVLRHVVETDANASGGNVEPLAMIGVPEGVRQVVADRVRRLSAPTARTLRDACAFTGGFAFPVLQHLTQLSEGELLDCLDEAVEAGLLRAPAREAREYEFAHAIVRHALYEGQSRDRRVRLHRRIAAALEAAYAGHEDEHAADLTVHYHASAELAGASAGLRYALRAAEHARAAYAHDRVVTLLRMARDLAGEADPTTQVGILTRLALAEAETVRSREAFDSAQRALEHMAAAGASARERAEFVASLAHALKNSGASAELWDPLVDRGLDLLGAEHDVLWARLTLLRDHFEHLRSGNVGSSVWMGQDREAVAIARASGDETDYARTLEPLEWRTRAETDDIYQRSHTWTTPIALLRGVEVVVRDLMYKHGDLLAARRAAEELLALSRRYGAVSAEAEACTQIVNCAMDMGDFETARARMPEALQAVARLGPRHRLHMAPISFAVGPGYFFDADWPTVARDAETYARAAETQRSPVGMAAAAAAALALARANRTAEARTWLRDLATACERVRPTTYLQNWSLTAAAAATWEAEYVEAAATYRRLLLDSQRAGGGGPSVFGTVDLALARMATLVRDDPSADELFARAAAEAERAGHVALQAVVACDHARALVVAQRRDERIAALLARAISTFEALEMRSWLRRARSLQAGPRQATRSRSLARS